MTTQPVLPAEIIYRVFWITRDSKPEGTGIVIDVEGKQYFITAQHVASKCAYQPELRIGDGDSWTSRTITWDYVGENQQADVAVLAADRLLCPDRLYLDVGSQDLTYGMVGYALGFPTALETHEISVTDEGHPMPVPALAVAYFSGGDYACCSGYITSGYSGGAVVFPKPGSTTNEWVLTGIIAGFPWLRRPIDMDGAPVEFAAREHTGLIRNVPIGLVEEIIKSKPLGFPLVSG